MTTTQFVILVLVLLFGFGILDNSGCGCLVFSAASVVALLAVVL